MEDKSLEQLSENICRQIRETRGKILDDFYKVYAAQLMCSGIEDLNLDDICLVEQQCDGPLSFNRKYWFEHKPKFDVMEIKLTASEIIDIINCLDLAHSEFGTDFYDLKQKLSNYLKLK